MGIPGKDPRKDLPENLLAAVPGGACVVGYNKAFEAGRLAVLSDWFSDKTQAIESIRTNLVDLMVPFKARDVYHWEMAGSASIKAVLPALIPYLSYEGLEISDGGTAGYSYLEMEGMASQEEIAKTRQALFEYCKLDTLGMVRLVEVLKEMVW